MIRALGHGVKVVLIARRSSSRRRLRHSRFRVYGGQTGITMGIDILGDVPKDVMVGRDPARTYNPDLCYSGEELSGSRDIATRQLRVHAGTREFAS
jgi:uncharacterized protein with von Willebrand factor type A (vWA) domain